MTTELILANLAVILAAAVQASAGVGFMMIGSPLIGLINLAYLPGSLLMSNLALSATMILRERSAIERSEVPLLGIGLVAGTILGALVLTRIPADRLGLVFGAVILGAVALSALAPQAPLSKRNILIGASAGGFTGIVAGMHGPPLVMLYQREPSPKVRATFAGVFVFGTLLALTGLWLAGRFGRAELLMGFGLLPGTALGYGVGRMIAGRISQRTARAAMLAISGAGGALLLLKSL